MTNPSAIRWGIDLGGTKIECVAINTDNNQVLERSRIPAGAERGYAQVLSNIATLLHSVESKTGFVADAIGIGTPGSVDPTSGRLRGSNSQHLQNKPIGADLAQRLGIKVVVENDANCFALAETRMGAAANLEIENPSVFGVIMGTGVGGGLVIDNRLVSGRNQIAGEWGHNYLDASGGDCYCGKVGCVETVISGPALERHYAALSGVQRKLTDISAMAADGDDHAAQTVERLLHYFGIGISGVINMIDPDVIVIGGGVGNIDLLYREGVERVRRNVFTPDMKTSILKPTLGDSAGVFGAAFLV